MNNIFNTFFILSLLLQGTNAQVQPQKSPTLWNTFISIDYADAISIDVRDYYKSIVDSYRSAGIPIPTQTEFGRTWGINAGVLLTRLESNWVGISVGYLYSPAHSSYKDYAGTLKIDGSITSVEILFNYKVVLMKTNTFQINAGICPGLNYSVSTISQEVNYFIYPEKNLNKRWSENAWGPSFKATLGSSIPIGEFILSLDGGYLFNLTNVPKDRIFQGTKTLTQSGWNIGISGYILNVSFGTTL